MEAFPITIGADPELFVHNALGQPLSAHGMVPGSKEEPYPVKGGAVQVDGLALEFNIKPCETQRQFVFNINQVLAQLRAMVPDDCQFHIEPSVYFDHDHFADQPAEAKRLGCDPDFNAWQDGRMNPAPLVPELQKGVLRTASGHVHIGWTKDADIGQYAHLHACMQLVKDLDVMLGIPLTFLETDRERRQLYGKAGAFRPKPYGVEYRVLSNLWLKDHALMSFVYDAAHRTTLSYIRGGPTPSELWETISDGPYLSGYGRLSSAEHIINRVAINQNPLLLGYQACEGEVVRLLFKRYGIELPPAIRYAIDTIQDAKGMTMADRNEIRKYLAQP